MKVLCCVFALAALLSACSLTPVRSVPTEEQNVIFVAPTLVLPTATPTTVESVTDVAATAEKEKSCENVLSFLSDVTIPDGTVVAPGEEIDKRWEVENSGTCDWGKGYTIQLVDGDAMGAKEKQSLVPASAGKTTTIQIVFTAPQKPGTYRSAWQAATPNGDLFGDQFYVQVEVKN